MKIVAVTQRVVDDPKTGERRDALDQRWAPFLRECGLLPLLLPCDLTASRFLLQQVSIAGIVLTGGNTHEIYGGTAPERDGLDDFLIAGQQELNVPLMGVCRGMQSIQIFYGCRLGRIEGHVAVEHKIIPEYPGLTDMVVNSYHEFGTRQTPAELNITYRSEDGMVEAVRHTTSNIAGIMWHPERNNPFRAEDRQLFRKFFNCDGSI